MPYKEINKLANINAQKGKIFLTQRNIINKIAAGGSSSNIDLKLYDAFKNWLGEVEVGGDGIINTDDTTITSKDITQKAEVYNSVTDWSAEKLKNFIQKAAYQPIQVINNALTEQNKDKTKLIKVLSEYTLGKGPHSDKIFQIICPISSIFDAQASWGSCNFGLDPNKKTKDGKANRHSAIVSTNNMDIQITGTNGFLINLSLIFIPDKIYGHSQ